MPFDGKGKHHLNTQKAMAADKMPPRPARPAVPAKSGDGGPGVGDAMPHGMNEGDLGGDSTHDPSSHLAELHSAMGGKHLHIHQGEDGSLTSHTMDEDGNADGPTEHPDMEALHEHMGRFLAEEAREPEHGGRGQLHGGTPIHEHAMLHGM